MHGHQQRQRRAAVLPALGVLVEDAGRAAAVRLSELSYPDGYDFFESAHWRRGPVPFASDTRYRPPRAGDFFRTDEASLRAAQAQCLRQIDRLQQGGYRHDVLDALHDQPLADGQRPAVSADRRFRRRLEQARA